MRESHGSWGHKLCRRDLEFFFHSDIGMKTTKLRILIAQIVWQRSVGSLFPLQNLKKKIRRISCTQSVYVRSVGFCFFILNLFKYFVDFVISICLVCLKPDMFWLPRSEKKDAPPSTIQQNLCLCLGLSQLNPPHSGTFLWVRTDAIWYSSELKQPCWH